VQRVILFLFLVLVIPGLIYWASHDFESPALNIRRFLDETAALSGPPAPTPEPETKSARHERKQPDPQPKKTPDPSAGETEPEPPRKSAYELGQEHYDAGRFADAAATFAGHDKRMFCLSTLGASLQAAFPEKIPAGTYTVVTATGGTEFEGFGTEHGGMLQLTGASGRTLTLPDASIRSRMTLPTKKALDRIARRIATDSASATLSGTRLFMLVQEGFVIGRPAVVAPLLPLLLGKDAEKEFIMSAVLNRVPRARQDDVYRALGRCQSIQDEPPHETVRTPTRIGSGGGKHKPRRQKTSIQSRRARDLVAKAAPHKAEGKRLYKKVFLAGRDHAKLADVNKAVFELEKALGYYDKAREIEEAGEILALQGYCSKLAFKLRFWREQLGGK